jgi:plasmid stabilization system protein ParE
MSKPFEIRYLTTAVRDLENIFDYIVRDRPAAAVSLLEKFDHAISQLADFPELGGSSQRWSAEKNWIQDADNRKLSRLLCNQI